MGNVKRRILHAFGAYQTSWFNFLLNTTYNCFYVNNGQNTTEIHFLGGLNNLELDFRQAIKNSKFSLATISRNLRQNQVYDTRQWQFNTIYYHRFACVDYNNTCLA